ncbi:ABC transporter permease [Foetidibacter luteolus]|uniref:ABC transporter permease n=1 Tax=Foetidibacter luteolus TaxID=2608880 RepID=UPI00129A3098|nr:ABC transporter permease [Foetidibacter luteolus]
MLHLLKIEWLKVKNYKAFWIFLGLYLVGLFSINYILHYFQDEIHKEGIPFELLPYHYPKIYQTIAWVSSWLMYFPGMLMILIISNEYTFKTHRQNIIDGYERRQFIIAKILFGLVLALLTTIFCLIIAIIYGVSSNGYFSADGIHFIGYCFIQACCYLFFAMILAVLLRRSGLALAIFFLYGIIFEQLLGLWIDNKLLDSHSFFYYMPLEASDVLIPDTVFKNILYKESPSEITLLIVCLLYIGLYCFFAIRKFEKDDL